METEPDPWDWGVNEVVHEFCHRRTLWLNRPTARLPDPIQLERVLRENYIDGATLLYDMKLEDVKDVLGIVAYAEKNAIMWGIKELKHRSPRYLEEIRSEVALQQAQQAVPTGSLTPSLRDYSTSATPLHPYSSQHLPIIHGSPFASISSEHTRDVPALEASPVLSNQPQISSMPIKNQNPSPERRKAETLEQNDGQKKRRLNLAVPVPLLKPSVATAEVWPGSSPDRAPIQLPSRLKLSGIVTKAPSYLGRNKLTQDNIFFGSGDFGEPINSDVGPKPTKSEFCLLPERSIPGRQKYVYRQMIHYFHQNTIEVMRGEQIAAAVYPYTPVDAIEENRSAILFRPTESGYVATRERATTLTTDVPSQDATETNSNREWNFLLERYAKPESDEEFPLYGESVADTDWSNCLKELEEELKEEQEPDQRTRGPLTKEEVLDVIDEEISDFVAKWMKQKRPLREQSSWKIWKKDLRARKQSLIIARVDRLRSSERLARLNGCILDEVWHSAKAVRDQCKSLEETAIQREEAQFKLSVLQRKDSPPRPNQEIKAKKKTVRASIGQDDISLDSDSEVATETDSLNGFVDIDDTLPSLDLTDRHDSPDSTTDAALDEDMEDVAPVSHDEEIEDNVSVAVGEDMEDDSPEVQSDKDSVLGNNGGNSTPPGSSSDTLELPLAKLGTRSDSKILATSGSSSIHVIDLTLDTEDSPQAQQTFKSPLSMNWGNNPLKDLDDAVNSWVMEELEEREDYKRIVIKLVRTLPVKEYSEFHRYVANLRAKQLVVEIETQIKPLLKDNEITRSMVGATEAVRLYLCWFERKPEHFAHEMRHGVWGFTSAPINKSSLKAVRAAIRNGEGKDLKDFCVFLERIFERFDAPIVTVDLTKTKRTAGHDAQDTDDDSDLDELPASQTTPHKKRKREVAESQNARQIRERIRRTLMENEDRARVFLQQSSDLVDLTQFMYIINPGKKEEEPPIHIDSYIAQKIQQHQVDGVRFMWREIVAATNRPEDMQGCLLAHTMGLGKTMQAITLLVAIAEASRSPDKAIRSQIPKSLRAMRTLILCPASLIFNWEAEFSIWNKHDSLGKVWSIEAATMKVSQRLANLQNWSKQGGVLLVSYDFFRNTIENKAPKNGEAQLSPKEHDTAKDQLLNGPMLIVADEAHQLKNRKSGISKAVKQFKSTSRIALTGSPLSNNLEEYYSMIEWIAPGYLGESQEFKAHYVEPIQQGTYQDSTPQERQIARRKLKALEQILEPKIHRREVTVLKGSLKPKIEFIIKVPLTEMQDEAYRAFIKSVNQGDISNTRLWAWMDKLSLLCSHPLPFWNYLQTVAKGDKSPPKGQPNQSGGSTEEFPQQRLEGADTEMEMEIHDFEPLEAAECLPLSITRESTQQLEAILEPLQADPQDIRLSNKSRLLLEILKFSIKIGDKVLVFSQSIVTLDFLEILLTANKIRYCRLDGKSKMSSRPQMIKDFSRSDSNCDVFLISTKAGGLGLNLPVANRVVIYDFSFNPTHEEQAVGRAYRLGQAKPVFVYRFISAGTFEENLHNTTVFKIQLAYRVVEKRNTKSLATKQNEWLRPPKVVTQHDLTEYLGKDKILDRILREMVEKDVFHIREIKTTETLQQESDEIMTAEDVAEVERMVADEEMRLKDPVRYKAEQLRRQVAEIDAARKAVGLVQANSGLPVSNSNGHASRSAIPPPRSSPKPRQEFQSALNYQPHDLPSHSTTPTGGLAFNRNMPRVTGRMEALNVVSKPAESPIQTKKVTATGDTDSTPLAGSPATTASSVSLAAKALQGVQGAFSWVGAQRK